MANLTDHSPRQVRHLSFISEFSTNIQHCAGLGNAVADALSRPPLLNAIICQDVDYGRPGEEQAISEEIHAYRTSLTNMVLEDVPFGAIQFYVMCRPADHGRYFPQHGQGAYLMPFIAFPTWEHDLPYAPFQRDLFGIQ